MSGGVGARLPYLALALVTIVVGLGVHGARTLDPSVRDVLGDLLWATMMMWWLGVVAPRSPLRLRAPAALAVCFIVEASQRYHPAALDALRRTTPGRLVLGSGFDPRDLVAYTAGVLLAAAVERAWLRRA